MFTTVASSTTMNWAMQAITSTSQRLVLREESAPAGGLSRTVALMLSVSWIFGAFQLNWTSESGYGITTGPRGPVKPVLGARRVPGSRETTPFWPLLIRNQARSHDEPGTG